MKKVFGCIVLLVGVGSAAWWYWRSTNQANAEAWASGTDRID